MCSLAALLKLDVSGGGIFGASRCNSCSMVNICKRGVGTFFLPPWLGIGNELNRAPFQKTQFQIHSRSRSQKPKGQPPGRTSQPFAWLCSAALDACGIWSLIFASQHELSHRF